MLYFCGIQVHIHHLPYTAVLILNRHLTAWKRQQKKAWATTVPTHSPNYLFINKPDVLILPILPLLQ